jgi:lipopolysaccharide export system protein LptA
MLKKALVILMFLLPIVVFSQEGKRIDIVNADELSFVKTPGREVKVLKGNVIFKHDNAIMKCDSAYFYSLENSMEAFGNVKIEMGDSVRLFCDYLKYDGTKKIAYTRHNIRLYHKNSSLFTDSLDYYRNQGIAKYYTHGTIITDEDTLTSNYGYYMRTSRDFFPSGNVIVHNPNFVMHTDSLRFNTKSKKVFFLTNTTIENDSGAIKCISGNYNTVTNIAIFGRNTMIAQKDKIIYGDSIFYDSNKELGIGYKNFVVIDTAQKIIISGKYGEVHGETNTAFVTDSACFMQVDNDNDTLFLHSDTLRSVQDSAGKKIYAYYNVKFYKSDIQGKCDSMVYDFSDSLTYMYGKPVIWTDNYQLFARQIEILSGYKGIKKVSLYQTAFVAEQLDTSKFNQIKGKNIFAYFNDGEIKKVEVRQNSETVYYPEDDSSIIGLYNANSIDIDIFMDSSKVSKIVFLKNPEGALYPLNMVPDGKDILTGFAWLDIYRPETKEEIFESVETEENTENNNENK